MKKYYKEKDFDKDFGSLSISGKSSRVVQNRQQEPKNLGGKLMFPDAMGRAIEIEKYDGLIYLCVQHVERNAMSVLGLTLTKSKTKKLINILKQIVKD